MASWNDLYELAQENTTHLHCIKLIYPQVWDSLQDTPEENDIQLTITVIQQGRERSLWAEQVDREAYHLTTEEKTLLHPPFHVILVQEMDIFILRPDFGHQFTDLLGKVHTASIGLVW